MNITVKYPDGTTKNYILEVLRQELLEGKVTADYMARYNDEDEFKPVIDVLYASPPPVTITDDSVAKRQCEGIMSHCPKCGNKLGRGVSRCWTKGCDYVVPAGIIVTEILNYENLIKQFTPTSNGICHLCANDKCGNSANIKEWLLIKKTGEVESKEKKVMYYTLGPMPKGNDKFHILGYRVDVLQKFNTIFCSDCVTTLRKELETEYTNKEKQYNEEGNRLKRESALGLKIFLLLLSFFLITSGSAYGLWRVFNINIPNWVIYTEFVLLGLSAFCFLCWISTADDKPLVEKPDLEKHTVYGMYQVHEKLLTDFVARIDKDGIVKVLLSEQTAGIESSRLFVMSTERYERDNFNGYAIFCCKESLDDMESLYKLIECNSKIGQWLMTKE